MFTKITGAAFFAALSLGSITQAANVFVTSATGSNLTRAQQEKMTGLVRRAVENMPEHKVVLSESEADFVLRPSIVRRDTGPFLRIEKSKEKELIAVAEQPIDITSSIANAQSVTQTALQIDSSIGKTAAANVGRNPSSADDTISGATSPAGPAANLPPSADSMDTRSLHNTPTSGTSLNENPTVSNSFTTPDGMVGRDTQTSFREETTPAASENVVPTDRALTAASGDVRAPSPRLADRRTPGYFQMGLGPSFAIGLNSDNIMYDINGAYGYNVSEQVTAKGFADFNIGTGSDSAQFINLGAGAEVYPDNWPTFGGAKPYVQGDLGYAFARTSRSATTGRISTGDGISVGAGAGFKFEASELNWDIAAHYSLLTSQIDERTPSLLGIRAALNF